LHRALRSTILRGCLTPVSGRAPGVRSIFTKARRSTRKR
jgi:hypothetical protein